MATNGIRLRHRITHFLFWTKPEENTFPLQTRVTIIAIYATVLAGLIALPYNLISDFQSEAYTLVAFQLMFMALSIMGLVSFWATRSLSGMRIFFAAALIILSTGLILGAGGVRGLGFFYFIVGYAILYYVLGLIGGIVLPLYILIGTIIRISMGSFNPESYLNDPDFTTRYLVLLSVATILGIFSVVYQHFIIRHLYRLAYLDDVTNLPNRKRLDLLISEWIRTHRHQGTGFSLIGIKLSNFSQVNSFQGARFADKILKTVGERIDQLCITGETTGRYSGTVFVTLTRRTEFLALEEFGSQILQQVQLPVELEGHTIVLQANVSITRYPPDAEQLDSLMANVMAGFSRMAGQPGFVSFFDESIHQEEARRYTMLGELRHAVANKEFTLAFQPKIHLQTGACQGAEVLLRWNSTLFGPVGPDVFIPLAEEGGLIQSITRWVIETTFQQISSLPDQDNFQTENPRLIHAINLSPLDIADPGLREFIMTLTQSYAMNPASIEFEITEGILMDESATVQANLEFIRNRKFRLAIDDFGTGYSSLSYLHRLRASNLKIDRSFIQPINESNPESPIVDAVISMAKTLSLKTTAEGVETPFQRDYLRSRGCDLAQGYLYARPMDFNSYRNWLIAHSAI